MICLYDYCYDKQDDDFRCLINKSIPKWPELKSINTSIVVLFDLPNDINKLRSMMKPFRLTKMSGGGTNSIYRMDHEIKKDCNIFYILRVYNKTDEKIKLFDRDIEIKAATLLSEHEIGPTIYVLFNNGRIEKMYDGTVMTEIKELNNENYKQIMREVKNFHKTSINISNEKKNRYDDWSVIKSIKHYRNIIKSYPDQNKELLQRYPELDQLSETLITDARRIVGPSANITGCHNDLHHGNMIVSYNEDSVIDIKLIDFEYFGKNPRLYDLANYFNELYANYTAYDLYPDLQTRKMFYEFYMDKELSKQELESLDVQVDVLAKINHLNWGLWSLVKHLSNNGTSTKEDIGYNYSEYYIKRLDRFHDLSK
jgi:thiamine kinase-like enzyme